MKHTSARRADRIVIAVDVTMIVLLLLNLGLILFDSAYLGSEFIRHVFRDHTPRFYESYEQYVRKNFALVDALFVSIFVTEFLIRWVVAIRRRDYHRWFFYPLVHWYDVLGCIPIGSMRFLRLLRLFSIGFRMQRMGIVDFRNFYLYRVFAKYRDVVIEEVSDRVVVQVLSGVQAEVAKGTPVVDRIWSEVLAPHKDVVVSGVADTADAVIDDVVDRERRRLLAYSDRVLDRALARSQSAFRPIGVIPVLGKTVVTQLQVAIKQIVGHAIDELLTDLKEQKTRAAAASAEDAVVGVLEARNLRIDEFLADLIQRSIDIIKDQVLVQHWKVRELEERQASGG